MITNPITKRVSPDPFVTYDKNTKYYYSVFSEKIKKDQKNQTVLKISRSKKAKDILSGDEIVVYSTENGVFKSNIWAPEMHFIDGKWYIYTSGFLSENFIWENVRLFVMRSKTQNPFDGFEFVKMFEDPLFAIDPTVYKADDGKLYICYSQNSYAYGKDYYEQRLYIREMLSPIELSEKVACISKADTKKELSVPNEKINEGPFFVKTKGKLFIVYSANGCSNEDYCLCVLEYTGGEMVSELSWKKLDNPLLYKNGKLFGTGHASFFKSPDESELWCAFHSILDMSDEKEFKDRFACLNKVEIDKEGYLIMGKAKEIEETDPSGE